MHMVPIMQHSRSFFSVPNPSGCKQCVPPIRGGGSKHTFPAYVIRVCRLIVRTNMVRARWWWSETPGSRPTSCSGQHERTRNGVVPPCLRSKTGLPGSVSTRGPACLMLGRGGRPRICRLPARRLTLGRCRPGCAQTPLREFLESSSGRRS